MYVKATFAPSRARACTIARPMPRLPPVTIAVLPENIREGFSHKRPRNYKNVFDSAALLSVRKREVDLRRQDHGYCLSVQIGRFVFPMRYRFDCRLDQHRGPGNYF